MPEEHIGTKFHTDLLPGALPGWARRQAEALISWCRRFDELGLAPDYGKGSCGNLSFRLGDGFVITPTAAYFNAILVDDLVLVLACDPAAGRVKARGKHLPSSESLLHHAVYRRRPEVQAVFHGHDDRVLEHAVALGLAQTAQPQPYGSAGLVAEVVAALGGSCYLVLKEHGFVSLGLDLDSAGRRALEVSQAAGALAGR